MDIINSSKKINQKIKYSITDKNPLSFGKIGNVESVHLKSYLNGNYDLYGSQLFVNAGIYTRNQEDYLDWCEALIKSLNSLDYVLQWNSSDKDLINSYFKKRSIFKNFEGLEPFVFGPEGWHYNLYDKKVLCVSPFSSTVKQQSKKFNKIWPGASIDEVLTVNTPHSEALTGQKPEPWRKKLETILNKINSLEFDFATVGCGGLSLLICQHIKEMGIPTVHLGGANQILYGIKGKRWDESFRNYEWYGNEEWTRPSLEETPRESKLVEDGCYW